MKVGILTFHKSTNYGSVFQAYALSDLLKKHGYDVEIIDYEPKIFKSQYGVFLKCNSKTNILTNLKHIGIYDILISQINGFRNFRKRYLPLSSQKYSCDSNFKDLEHKYDCIICGSDQVWNITAVDCDPIFFLPEINIVKKIAYAVSLNNASYEESRANEELKKQINDFDYISVREESGAEKLRRFIGSKKNVTVQPDPTILREKDDFSALIDEERIVHQPYIFMYSAFYQKSTIEAAKALANKYHLPIYTLVVTKSFKSLRMLSHEGIIIKRWKNKPQDFLKYIRDADFIVTNSFHGTAFSIIFEKKFVVVNDNKLNGGLLSDERLVNILKKLNLERLLVSLKDISSYDVSEPIDYKQVTETRKIMAAQSIKELFDVLEKKGENENRTF